MTLRTTLLVVALALLPLSAFADGARFGFTLQSKSDGPLPSSRFKQVWISAVQPNSPASSAGLLSGDSVLSLNEKPVSTLSAESMPSLMKSLSPGDHLRLKIERTGGIIKVIDIVAVAK